MIPNTFEIARDTVRRELPNYDASALDKVVSAYKAEVAAIERNQELTSMGKAMATAREAQKLHGALKSHYDAIDRDEKAIDAAVNTELSKLIPARPTSTIEEQRHSEIRGYLRTLAPSDRRRVVVDALHAGDVEVISAVEHAPVSMPVADSQMRQLIDEQRRAKAEAAVPGLQDRRGELALKRMVLSAATSIAPAVASEAA